MQIINKIDTCFILPDATVKQALAKLNETARKILFIVDTENKLIGTLTDGDIRRHILNSGNLDSEVIYVGNNNPFYINENYDVDTVKAIFTEKHFQAIPVVDTNNTIINILFLEEILSSAYVNGLKKISGKVVIMAGGKGTRLDPFTRILPKLLIPIGEKPFIEIILGEYAKYGINDFYISINYKAKLIKAYLEDNEYNYNIQYLEEDKPLGTAGCLKHLKGKVPDSFFVSNCDIFIKDDYANIYEFHKKNEFDLTMVASIQHHVIPYGVCELETGGELKLIREKPQFDFLVNTGMYILEPSVLEYIPDNVLYNMTDLIESLKKANKKIGVYPVSQKSWVDIGQWEEYKKTLNFIF